MTSPTERSAGPECSRCQRPALCVRALSLALFLACIPGQSAVESMDRVVVIVNPMAPAPEVVSHVTLSAVFGMRLRTWDNGLPIHVYVLPDNHPVHVAFCKQILGVFAHQMRSAWDRLVYSGTGQAPGEVDSEEKMRATVAGTVLQPVTVSSEEEMRRAVAGQFGAIGYLTNHMADESVAVLSVQ